MEKDWELIKTVEKLSAEAKDIGEEERQNRIISAGDLLNRTFSGWTFEQYHAYRAWADTKS